MLARVANNLFWMGRYIERAEHVSRYLNVNYFSSLDAPNKRSQDRQLVLRSMLFMVDDQILPEEKELIEKDVLYDIALNPETVYSIINCVQFARENANSARDLISTELYEALNKFYYFVLNYEDDFFKSQGLYDFTSRAAESATILRGKIRGTLLHDEVYAVIMLGMNLERAMQIIRIIHAKYRDALDAKGSYGDTFKNSYEWTTLLRCAESYDMMRRFYKKTPTSISTLEFLILNPKCPRSVMNSLNQINKHIKVIDGFEPPTKNSAAFLIGRMRTEYEYKVIEEIEGVMDKFIEDIQAKLLDIAVQIESDFFNY